MSRLQLNADCVFEDIQNLKGAKCAEMSEGEEKRLEERAGKEG